jgi:hypothetical protein
VTALWSNPEFIRNVRGQLRPGKVIATACICAAISIAVGFAISRASHVAAGPYGWGSELLQVAIWLQALMLAAGGGIACINSIYREKEQNTFDFQRVTQMTPLELALGKLFGAPIFTYSVCLCMMPLAIFGAVMGKTPASVVVGAYAVLFVGSLAMHVLALLISLLTVRGSHTGAILLLLVLLWGTSVSGSNLAFFQVGPFGPFYAAELAQRGSWVSSTIATRDGTFEIPGMVDSFFGQSVHHVPVFIAVDLLFAVWFLLAVVRNIKRDPNYYEIYSPMQAMGFAMFINLLFVAFFRWRSSTPIDCQAYLLTLNIAVFFCLGLALIRNQRSFLARRCSLASARPPIPAMDEPAPRQAHTRHRCALPLHFLRVCKCCNGCVWFLYRGGSRTVFRVLCSLAHLFAGPCRMGLTPRDLGSSFCCAVDPHRRVHWAPAENSC